MMLHGSITSHAFISTCHKKGRDINYLMTCLLALPPRERLLKGAVWCWSHIFTWKQFLFETVATLELGIEPVSLESQFS
jgi:hypothetical protein